MRDKTEQAFGSRRG